MNPSAHRPVELENANGVGKLLPNAVRKGRGTLAWSDHGGPAAKLPHQRPDIWPPLARSAQLVAGHVCVAAPPTASRRSTPCRCDTPDLAAVSARIVAQLLHAHQ